jgi:radical SAM protein with 4Fe4S-binding SPASM domain
MIPLRNIKRAIGKAISQPAYGWQAFRRRFLSYLTYKLFNGYSAYPETISLFLTYRCNLRCKMCGQWGMVGSSKDYPPEMLREQLSLKEIEALLNDVRAFRPNITLFGGEPFIYREWPEIVKMVKERGMRCNIITNGVLLSDNAEKMVDLGVDEVIFSLDGPKDIHDEMRSSEGTFDKAYSGFKKLEEIKNRRGEKKPLVNISSTVFEVNYNRLDEIVMIAEEMGAVSITFHHLIFTGRDAYKEHNRVFQECFTCISPDWAGFIRDDLPEINPEELLKKMEEIKSMKTSIDVSFYPNYTEDEIKRYYSNFEFWPSSYRKRCISPWMVAYIFPDGSVRPCQSLNFSAGSLRESPFRNIWNSERYRNYRRVVKERKAFPVCSRCTEYYRF